MDPPQAKRMTRSRAKELTSQAGNEEPTSSRAAAEARRPRMKVEPEPSPPGIEGDEPITEAQGVGVEEGATAAAVKQESSGKVASNKGTEGNAPLPGTSSNLRRGADLGNEGEQRQEERPESKQSRNSESDSSLEEEAKPGRKRKRNVSPTPAPSAAARRTKSLICYLEQAMKRGRVVGVDDFDRDYGSGSSDSSSGTSSSGDSSSVVTSTDADENVIEDVPIPPPLIDEEDVQHEPLVPMDAEVAQGGRLLEEVFDIPEPGQPLLPASDVPAPRAEPESEAPNPRAEPESDLTVPLSGPDVTVPIPQPGVTVPLSGSDVTAPIAEPAVTAPIAEPAVTAPIPQPDVSVPLSGSDVTAPIPEPGVTAPIPEPGVTAPIPESDVTAPIPESDVAAPIPEPDVTAPIPKPDAPAPHPESGSDAPVPRAEPKSNAPAPHPEPEPDESNQHPAPAPRPEPESDQPPGPQPEPDIAPEVVAAVEPVPRPPQETANRVGAKVGVQMKKRSTASRAGLVFPPVRFQGMFKKYFSHKTRVSRGAGIYTAAVIEYLTAELLELAGDARRSFNCIRTTPRHICLAIRADEDLSRLLDNVIIPQGGVPPHIEEVLLPRKK